MKSDEVVPLLGIYIFNSHVSSRDGSWKKRWMLKAMDKKAIEVAMDGASDGSGSIEGAMDLTSDR